MLLSSCGHVNGYWATRFLPASIQAMPTAPLRVPCSCMLSSLQLSEADRRTLVIRGHTEAWKG